MCTLQYFWTGASKRFIVLVRCIGPAETQVASFQLVSCRREIRTTVRGLKRKDPITLDPTSPL